MIQPEDIRRKAERLYPIFLRTWLEGKEFFPRDIPSSKRPDPNLATAIESVRQLRAESKEFKNCGYSVEWEERRSRTHGRNEFPRRIFFETEHDLLTYLGKQREFKLFAAAVERIRACFPVLAPWINSHRQLVLDSLSDVDGLIEVVEYLRQHPRPGLFARELPLAVDTKFIQRNQRVLREWLDRVLPPECIRAEEEHFDRRYGLRYVEPHILLRFLDPALQRSAAFPWAECSVPLHSLAATEIPGRRVVIVENKVNLLTLPPTAEAVALGGLGNGVIDLRYLGWLSRKDIWYWGDIDVEGFVILSRLRTAFPSVRSLMMSEATLSAWRERLGTSGTGRTYDTPTNLTATEQAAFSICLANNLRIEQERIPQPFVVENLRANTVGFS